MTRMFFNAMVVFAMVTCLSIWVPVLPGKAQRFTAAVALLCAVGFFFAAFARRIF